MSRLGSNIFILLLVLWGVSACGLLNGPGDEVLDPRNLTWTVDTLVYPEGHASTMANIWGSSPKDVYVVGRSSTKSGLVYHFDGKQWTNDERLSVIQGTIGLNDVYGFGADDVWVVGKHGFVNPEPPPNFLDSTLIVHYDGHSWQEFPLTGRRMMGVWGQALDDVYAVGEEGTIFHYNGQAWSREQLPYPVQLLSIAGDGHDLFTAGILHLGTGLDTAMIFHHGGNGWELMDRQPYFDFVWSPRFGLRLFSPAPGFFVSVGEDIFHWQGAEWDRALDSDSFLIAVGGSAADNVFAVGQNTSAFHWNGVDWQELNIPRDQLPEVWFTGVWTDGREVFICGNVIGTTYILHGK